MTSFTPKNVVAYGQKNYLKNKKENTYDSIQGIIEWEKKDGSKMSFHISNWIDSNKSSAMSDQVIKFIGTKVELLAIKKIGDCR